MKFNLLKNAKRGIAMTEYLIILAIVAIAAILVVGLFGKQIKQAFTSQTAAMSGNVEENQNHADESKVKTKNMGTAEDEAKGVDQ